MSFGGTSDELTSGAAAVRTAPGWFWADGRPTPASQTTLVVGLGNPVLGDDGVGWKVIDALEGRLLDGSFTLETGTVELDRMAVGGLTLMERLVGYERAIIADAVLGPERLGTVWSRPLEAVSTPLTGHLDSAHDASLGEAIAAGRALGARLPDEITVVGIAVRRVNEFDERLSPVIARAVGPATDAIVALLSRRSAEVV